MNANRETEQLETIKRLSNALAACVTMPSDLERDHTKAIRRLAAINDLAREHITQTECVMDEEPEEGGQEALLWFGHLEDVTDIYPERRIYYGPRGGIHIERC